MNEITDEEILAKLISKDPSPSDIVDNKMAKETLHQMLYSLPTRERLVLDHCFGLTDDKVLKLKDIAKIFNLSSTRIRHIERKAIRRLVGVGRDDHLWNRKQLRKALELYRSIG